MSRFRKGMMKPEGMKGPELADQKTALASLPVIWKAGVGRYRNGGQLGIGANNSDDETAGSHEKSAVAGMQNGLRTVKLKQK